MNYYKIICDDVDVFLCNMVNGWKIELDKVQYGHYYLPCTPLSTRREAEFQASTSGEERVIIIHRILGHELI